jgi:penicillin amidase
MEFQRRRGRGTLSEAVGIDAIVSDRWARTLNFRELGESDLLLQRPIDLHVLNSYAAGVTHYIRSISWWALPLEMLFLGMTDIDPWRPEDTLIILRLDAFLKSIGLEDVLAEAYIRDVFDEKTSDAMLSLIQSSPSSKDISYANGNVFGVQAKNDGSVLGIDLHSMVIFTCSHLPLLFNAISQSILALPVGRD